MRLMGVVVAIALGGCWGAPEPEPEPTGACTLGIGGAREALLGPLADGATLSCRRSADGRVVSASFRLSDGLHQFAADRIDQSASLDGCGPWQGTVSIDGDNRDFTLRAEGTCGGMPLSASVIYVTQ